MVALAMLIQLNACSSQEPTANDEPSRASLSDYLDFESYEYQVQWTEARHNAIEEAIRACMQNEGFEYRLRPFDRKSVPRPLLATREEVMERGIGYVAGVQETSDGQSSADPNDTVKENLDASTLAAWDLAAYGNDSTAGCVQKSTEEISSPWLEPMEMISEARSDLEARIASDRRIVELDEEWSSCMAKSDYNVASPDQLSTFIESSLPPYDQLVTAPLAEIETAKSDEIRIALASFDCRDPLKQSYAVVRDEYEQDFIEQHSLELSAVRAEIGRMSPNGS